ncbi:MAG: phosphopentomutase [Fusobacterium sp.]
MDTIKRVIMIILDSVGVGELPDAKLFGDVGSNTLAHIGEITGGLTLPNMEKLGLGNIINIKGVSRTDHPMGLYGKAKELAKGKDTTTGHWEIAGLVTETPFPTYPNGFPKSTMEEFEKRTGRKTLCNLPYSGTEVINDYGDKATENGDYIIYTSADPVFQIAAHEEKISLDELYKACEIALEICNEKSPVARVIARPFIGENGNYTRTSNRHDFSVLPLGRTLLDDLKENNLDVVGVGKINDIFAGKGITENKGSNRDNLDGIMKTIAAIKENTKGLIFTNLVDFDSKYGHRRNALGYKEALEEFDRYLPEIIGNMKDSDLLIISADHGCDPTFKGTDHTREYIPILAYSKDIKSGNIGTRESFSDIADTIKKLLIGKESKYSFIK